MRYRIALCGFSEFEYQAMHFSFQHPTGFHESEYDVVGALSEADFAIVDADSMPAVKGVLQSGRVAHSVFVGTEAPLGAASHLHRPIDPTRILRTLDELCARQGMPTQPGALRELPTLNDALPQAPIEAATVIPPAAPIAPATAKAAARAKSRRARLASDERRQTEPLRDALVLDANGPTNGWLCTLLGRFGFIPYAAGTIAQAETQLARRAFAAIFLDIPLDGAGIALLRRIRTLPAPWPHAGPAVLMVAERLDPTDRVRAVLAGLAEPLIKPLGRGDVARALESAGVVLPADARRQ